MVSKTICAALLGVDAALVQVEVDIGEGLPSFDMVGLLASEVREARERVRTALRNSGIFLPSGRVTINLSPANIRKEGTGFDLGIAAAILVALGLIEQEKAKNVLFIGELGLDGRVNGIKGVLPMVMAAAKKRVSMCVVSKDNVKEACLESDIKVVQVESIYELISKFQQEEIQGENACNIQKLIDENYKELSNKFDFSQVIGQASSKRAVEVAVAGMHNLLLMGAPGCGKSLMAKCIPGILPKLTSEECIEITRIHSAGGKNEFGNVVCNRPFISLHHCATPSSIMGGGINPTPGALSLAHGGVLYLDEFPEFPRKIIESLRQPLEDGEITISRVHGNFVFQTDVMLVAAMNPCPCGYYPDRNRCKCTEHEINRYLSKISGPMLDRIDICSQVDKIDSKDLQIVREKHDNRKTQEKSRDIRKRVEVAREIQKDRFKNSGIRFNSQMNPEDLKKYCSMDKETCGILNNAYEKLGLSARAYHRILKVSRTISDLRKEENITKESVLEAISYKVPDVLVGRQ